ncbi:exopolysaccharide biosynthesis polyprenyl glycosylphosphotransferase [Candidatus Wolfebacteria bacterium]|nr:exopolysaccharide biosynthesis polyprenyl glycosylphosphotransferase [Candidatus Wolfebacteria bacterium]
MLKIKTTILILGDIFLLYLSLALTLVFRYGPADFQSSFGSHLQPFSAIFLIWILIFYLTDCYEIRSLKRDFVLIRNLAGVIILAAAVSVILFYLFLNFFNLTPKTNLALFGVIFFILDLFWKFLIIRLDYARTNLLAMGNSSTIQEIVSYLRQNPQLGYNVAFWLDDDLREKGLDELRQLIVEKDIDLIILPTHFIKDDTAIIQLIYRLLPLGVKTLDSADFFEMIFRKIPIEELEEGWFVGKIVSRRKAYDALKRAMDAVLSICLGLILLPIMIINSVLIKLTSEGPIFYPQKRLGKNSNVFTLYKFRTMRNNHEGPLWTTANDKRLTFLGKILRYSHLDELPQLWNILKGDISFIGPRPERVELAREYQNLPYYEIRHVIKPGLTGWAQVNYRPSASPEEAFEKLKYDIYYIKNRSFILDIFIILKTIRLFFSNPE